jgi:hypothetical protein
MENISICKNTYSLGSCYCTFILCKWKLSFFTFLVQCAVSLDSVLLLVLYMCSFRNWHLFMCIILLLRHRLNNELCILLIMYFCIILWSLIFTNCIFSLHNVFYYIVSLLHVLTLCVHHRVLLLCTITLTLVSTFHTIQCQGDCTKK